MSREKILYSGVLRLANSDIPCYVTEGGKRILSGRQMQSALGLINPDYQGEQPGSKLRRLFEYKRLKPFFNNDFPPGHFAPIMCYEGRKGIHGYEASTLADICELMLEARSVGALTESQERIADQCEILMRGIFRVGIDALVDEATGYQDIRDRNELEAMLDKYLRPYQARWAKRFPDKFYKEIFRLKGWEWQGMTVNRPQVVGHYTNDIIYMRIAPGLLSELQRLNPVDDLGERHYKHHQWLTDDFGQPELYTHLAGVVAVMKTVTYQDPKRAWPEFMRRLQRAYPKKNMTFALDFDEDDS